MAVAYPELVSRAHQIAQKTGWKVFLLSDAKVPQKGSEGFYEATDDIDKLSADYFKHSRFGPPKFIAYATGTEWLEKYKTKNRAAPRHVLGSGVVVVEFDFSKHPEASAWYEENKHRIPPTFTYRSRSGGLHIVFKADDKRLPKALIGKIAPGVDFKGPGGYCVAWFAHVDELPQCEIVDKSKPAEMPAWLVDLITGLYKARPAQLAQGQSLPSPRSLDALAHDVELPMDRPIGIKEGNRDELLFKWGCAKVNDGWAFDQILAELRYCNSTFPEPLPDDIVETKATSAWKYATPQTATVQVAQAPVTDSAAPTPIATIQVPAYSEDHLALLFTERHAHEIRYTAALGRYYKFNGRHWQHDKTLGVYELARLSNRDVAVASNGLTKQAKKGLTSSKMRAAVEQLARADRRIAATVEQWDSNPWLLNTPGATIDLKTGAFHPHKPEDYITKATPVTPNDKGCPRWLKFIDEITGGDDDLATYLKKMVGYALTGVTTEHVLFFLYGRGANGKGVFTTILQLLLGEYHCTAPIETFTVSGSDRHPTELAKLVGARCVTSTETQEGRSWDETKIKVLTGGDQISARFMRQDFFDYIPQFKLIISGNHRPRLRSVDEAIRRRMRLIPFDVIIPTSERDPLLVEKLRTELPGILLWAIEGCVLWQREGLEPPARVLEATEAYLASEDVIGNWITSNCVLDGAAWTATTALHTSFKTWADQSSEKGMGIRAFSQALALRAELSFRHTMMGNGYDGIRFKDLPAKPYAGGATSIAEAVKS